MQHRGTSRIACLRQFDNWGCQARRVWDLVAIDFSLFTGEWFSDFLFIHGLFPQQEGSFCPFTSCFCNHRRMLNSVTRLTRVHSLHSQVVATKAWETPVRGGWVYTSRASLQTLFHAVVVPNRMKNTDKRRELVVSDNFARTGSTDSIPDGMRHSTKLGAGKFLPTL